MRWLLVAAPVSWALAWLGAPPVAVFLASGIAVMPLAAEMGHATEALAARAGPAAGGLLNATFGNAAELIVAIVGLRARLLELVKASLVGSILGNLLLILRLAPEAVVSRVGVSQLFLGLIAIPLIGNAAEHAVAVAVARRGQMDLALHVALGSSTQIALFVTPVLVAVGALSGRPVNLVFTSFEVVTLGLASLIVTIIGLDGESHWFEGVQLLAVYALIAIAGWFI